MVNVVEQLYNLTSRLICGEQATAFLIDKDYAITAKHAVNENISNGVPISMEFYSGKEVISKTAKVINYSKEYDIAILKLDEEVTHVSSFLLLNNMKVEPDNVWETVGYPRDWEMEPSVEGSKYCYIRGEVFQITTFDTTTIYDIHLSSKYLKEEWAYGLNGLSGSPMVVNENIVGIIIREEYSAINSPLKVISINKIFDFLKINGINVQSSSTINKVGRIDNHLNKRMTLQKNMCSELFEKIEYEQNFSGLNLLVDSYYLKYNDNYTPKIKELAQYLANALVQYACTLVDIDDGIKDPMNNFLKITQKTQQSILRIQEQDKLGAILLWMLLEGLLGVPKAFKRIGLDNAATFNEIHVGMGDNNKLVLYMGDGKINGTLLEAIEEVMEELETYTINIQDDFYLIDDYTYDNIEVEPLKKLLDDFVNTDSRDWNNVICELTVFTGYNSNIFRKIVNKNLTKEEVHKLLSHTFKKEGLINDKGIYDALLTKEKINNFKINWFILPFNDAKEFENLVVNEAKGGR